jgi:hypothetical protein
VQKSSSEELLESMAVDMAVDATIEDIHACSTVAVESLDRLLENVEDFLVEEEGGGSETGSPNPTIGCSGEAERTESTDSFDPCAIINELTCLTSEHGSPSPTAPSSEWSAYSPSRAGSDHGDTNDELVMRRKRNREAAIKSRAKKRSYYTQMEKDVQDLRERQVSLEASNSHLQSENKFLRDQISTLQRVLAQVSPGLQQGLPLPSAVGAATAGSYGASVSLAAVIFGLGLVVHSSSDHMEHSSRKPGRVLLSDSKTEMFPVVNWMVPLLLSSSMDIFIALLWGGAAVLVTTALFTQLWRALPSISSIWKKLFALATVLTSGVLDALLQGLGFTAHLVSTSAMLARTMLASVSHDEEKDAISAALLNERVARLGFEQDWSA